MKASLMETAPPADFTREPIEDERRIVTRRRVTATGSGGTAYVAVSLPRISMHVAAIAEAHRKQIIREASNG
ncbi:hypothetical protein [Rhizobium sp. LC145]|uniref:hypothetical protein n=1 Tax=Rhizobium sp. LC145 TaxID=1120688 RepID=UPI00062A3270|nr:hypothetical protein [Rhizobium sp. LC145]KKX24335.1 hypothetical protein YH62_27700 [Rhizobium sp. LC145]TKT46152.1 hypothetical protein FDR95_23615 [Rhizobiaceae bacterium LC148]